MKIKNVDLGSIRVVKGNSSKIIEWLGNEETKSVHLANSYTVTSLMSDSKFQILQNEYCILDGKYLALFFKYIDSRALTMRGADLFRQTLNAYPTKFHLIIGTPVLGVTKFREVLSEEFPNNLHIEVFNPPFTDNINEHIHKSSEPIITYKPDFVWVAIGTPKQDLLISELCKYYPGRYIGIGAAINFVGQSEAPIIFQKIGMEWLYRLIRNPRRLWRRYLVDGPKFIYILIFNFYRLKIN